MRAMSVAAVALGVVLSAMTPAYAVGSVDPAVSAPAGLEVVAYDGFDYPVGALSGPSNPAGANGGTGWTSSWSQGWPFLVNATSLTYPGLTSHGGKIYYAWTVGNSYSAGNRSLPRQRSGVVYVQFLSNISLNNGGGAPEVRLVDRGTTTAAIGNNGGPNIDLLDGTLDTHTATSSVPVLGLHFTIVRIDYAARTTKIWVDPNLSTFDYLNPGPANGTATNFAPAFDQLVVITKGGSYDEIAVMRVVPPAVMLYPDPVQTSKITSACVSADGIVHVTGTFTKQLPWASDLIANIDVSNATGWHRTDTWTATSETVTFTDAAAQPGDQVTLFNGAVPVMEHRLEACLARRT